MVLMPMLIFGTTSVDMKSRKGSPIPILLKQIMQNYGIIWLVWLASLVVFLVAHRHSVVPYAYLLSVSTAGNFTNSVSQNIQLTSFTS